MMQVTEHIHALKIPFQLVVGPGVTIDRFVYIYLIYGEQIYLVDTGVAAAAPALFDYLRSTGRAPEEIAMIIQTHSHPDHIGATRAIKETTGCLVAAHPAERSWIEDVELQLKERPVPSFHTIVGGSAGVDRLLEDGDVLDAGSGMTLEVLHTPGHSSGSLSLYVREDRALICGDAVPLPTDIPIYDDAIASAESLRKLKSLADVEVLLAAWDEPRKGAEVQRVLDEGLSYLQRIHEAVLAAAAEGAPGLPGASGVADPARPIEPAQLVEFMEFSKRVVRALGLPEAIVNPLVARSFSANLRARERRDLLQAPEGDFGDLDRVIGEIYAARKQAVDRKVEKLG